MTYAVLDPTAVADMIEHQTQRFKYAANNDLSAVVAHSNLILDVARYEGEIDHPTEWLDMVHADRCAALFVLSRRAERGYSIERGQHGGFSREFLDELKSRVPIHLIFEGAGAQLHRRSRGWVTRCPFPGHDDRYPSCFIYEETNSCWCFGCQRGGDLFETVMLLEGVEFPDAVRMMSSRGGMPIGSDRDDARIHGGFRSNV